jgi:hypothetical protein
MGQRQGNNRVDRHRRTRRHEQRDTRISGKTAVAPHTIDFVQIKQHYYIVHKDINPMQIVPKGPDLSNWRTPRGRDALGGRPFGDGDPPGPPVEVERVPPGHGATT